MAGSGGNSDALTNWRKRCYSLNIFTFSQTGLRSKFSPDPLAPVPGPQPVIETSHMVQRPHELTDGGLFPVEHRSAKRTRARKTLVARGSMVGEGHGRFAISPRNAALGSIPIQPNRRWPPARRKTVGRKFFFPCGRKSSAAQSQMINRISHPDDIYTNQRGRQGASPI
jgi:hypothetical protein